MHKRELMIQSHGAADATRQREALLSHAVTAGWRGQAHKLWTARAVCASLRKVQPDVAWQLRKRMCFRQNGWIA